MEIKRFLEKLSSGTPTPGGGSASALTGSLSASLVSMVAGLSLQKGKMGKQEAVKIRKKSAAIQRRLFQAIDEDATSFEAVMKSFGLPKNSEEERFRRRQEIQKAYQRATIAPQLVCEHAIRLLEYSKILILKGNPNAISDAGVAAFLADAALAGGLLNIGVNLIAVTEKMFLRKMNLQMKQWGRKRNSLMEGILKALRKSHENFTPFRTFTQFQRKS